VGRIQFRIKRMVNKMTKFYKLGFRKYLFIVDTDDPQRIVTKIKEILDKMFWFPKAKVMVIPE